MSVVFSPACVRGFPGRHRLAAAAHHPSTHLMMSSLLTVLCISVSEFVLSSTMWFRWDARCEGCASNTAAHVNAKGKGAVGNIISAAAASSNLVVTAGADNTVKAFDVRSCSQCVSQAKLTDFPYSLAVAGGLALCGCGDGSLLVIDVNNGQTLYALGANKAAVRGVHASKSCMVCVGDDGSVYMYDFA